MNICKVCKSKKRELIESGLVQGLSLRYIALHTPGIGVMSLQRHATRCLGHVLEGWRINREIDYREKVLQKVIKLQQEAEETGASAKQKAEHGLHLRSIDSRGRLVELEAKVTGCLVQKVEMDDKGIHEELRQTRKELEEWIAFAQKEAPELVELYLSAHGGGNGNGR